MNGPTPKWRNQGKQPTGTAGPKPRPNGQPVAEQPHEMHTLRRQLISTLNALEDSLGIERSIPSRTERRRYRERAGI